MWAQASRCAVFQIPASRSVIRPSALTADASTMMSPAPPVAIAPRCTRCQSWGTPSSLSTEYWHMGATQIRLRTVRPRRVIGRNSSGVVLPASVLVGGTEISVEVTHES